MLHLQMEEMRAEGPYRLCQLRLRRFSDFAKAAFEASLGLLALGVVIAGGIMVWNAAHSETLIIEALTVPPDMAARGLSGQALASQM